MGTRPRQAGAGELFRHLKPGDSIEVQTEHGPVLVTLRGPTVGRGNRQTVTVKAPAAVKVRHLEAGERQDP